MMNYQWNFKLTQFDTYLIYIIDEYISITLIWKYFTNIYIPQELDWCTIKLNIC